MSTSLLNLKDFGQITTNTSSIALKTNKKTGAQVVRLVLEDGRTLMKTITQTGVISEIIYTIPKSTSRTQRNSIIRDLAKQGINQETIAAMLNISQSTVSNVVRK